MQLRFEPYNQPFVDQLRAGGPDANGQPAETAVSDGGGNPCRSCLHDIPKGQAMLICAGRPFPAPQPYAEVGPIFFCKDACSAYSGAGLPPILQTSPDYLLKAYGHDHRIIYGTGQITQRSEVAHYASHLLKRGDVAYVDVRSARNNCFQTRITRDLNP